VETFFSSKCEALHLKSLDKRTVAFFQNPEVRTSPRLKWNRHVIQPICNFRILNSIHEVECIKISPSRFKCLAIYIYRLPKWKKISILVAKFLKSIILLSLNSTTCGAVTVAWLWRVCDRRLERVLLSRLLFRWLTDLFCWNQSQI